MRQARLPSSLREVFITFCVALPTVPRVLRWLEYVVGFSFGFRPTRTWPLQDGWFGACGPDGWLHESCTGLISVTAPKAAAVAKLSVPDSRSTRD